jgi:hypothetical protein
MFIIKVFIFCTFFVAVGIVDCYSQKDTNIQKNNVSIEELSRELGETNQHLNDLLSEIESRIVSDTLTQADLNVLIKALLDLDTPKAFQLILEHNKRYVRKGSSTFDLIYHIETGKPIYSIRYAFSKWIRPEQYARFREYVYYSDYLSEPIPEDDLGFIRFLLLDFPHPDREEDIHGIRKENLRRIRERD